MDKLVRNVLSPAVLGLALLVAPSSLSAQWTFSLGGGATFAELTNSDEFGSKAGIFSGFSVGIPVADRLSVGVGSYYVQKGFQDVEEDGETSDDGLTLTYLEFPVTLRYQLLENESVGLGVFAGPAFNIELNCTFESAAFDADVDCGNLTFHGLDPIETESFDVGIVGGVALSFPLSDEMSILVNGGFEEGLSDIDETEDEELTNRAFFIGAGLSWVIGG